jgi:hypothetical protein
MKIYLLKVENVIKIPKTYISRQFDTISRYDSKGQSANSDEIFAVCWFLDRSPEDHSDVLDGLQEWTVFV